MMPSEVISMALPNCWIDGALFLLLLLGPTLVAAQVRRRRRRRS